MKENHKEVPQDQLRESHTTFHPNDVADLSGKPEQDELAIGGRGVETQSTKSANQRVRITQPKK